MRLFCFGSLLDPDVRRIVLGRAGPAHHLRPAVLEGYRRVRVPDEAYPAALRDPGARIDGLLVENLSPRERARVVFFEGREFELREHPVLVDGAQVPALVCMATIPLGTSPEPWDYAEWVRRHKRHFLKAAAAYMAEFDRLSIDDAHDVWLRHRMG